MKSFIVKENHIGSDPSVHTRKDTNTNILLFFYEDEIDEYKICDKIPATNARKYNGQQSFKHIIFNIIKFIDIFSERFTSFECNRSSWIKIIFKSFIITSINILK